jgi:putative PIN family toxin of toxin-antitoxin system
MEVVLDTNVIVSGLISPNGPPGEIIDLIFSGLISPVFDDRILFEYRDVLLREKFSFSPVLVENLLHSICIIGRQVIPERTSAKLPDAADRCFYECALASVLKILVTGNIKHFPTNRCKRIAIYSPWDFLDKFIR